MDNDRIRQFMARIQQLNNNTSGGTLGNVSNAEQQKIREIMQNQNRVTTNNDTSNNPYTAEIDIMRANNNAGGSVGNVSNTEKEMFNAAAIAALRAQGASGNGILSNEEKARFMQLRNQQEQMKMNNTAPQDINSILKLINSPQQVQQVEKTYQFPNNPNTYTEEELAIIRYMQDKEM
tara:strand:+ start:2430 stop:2963 length:534 start_codon:yes stop_codon:yes gene_type:complete